MVAVVDRRGDRAEESRGKRGIRGIRGIRVRVRGRECVCRCV